MICLYQGRKRFVQWITVITILLLCAFVLLSSIYWKESRCFMSSICRKSHLAQTEKLRKPGCSSMCLAPDCIQQANRILTEIDSSAEPCDDFFLFLCKNFEPIENANYAVSYATAQSKLTAEVTTIIKNIRAPHDTASGKLKMVYDSCVDIRSEEGAVPAAIDFLRKIGIPDWPVISKDLDSELTFLSSCIANLLVHKEYAFVDLRVHRSDKVHHQPLNLTIIRDWLKGFVLEESEARNVVGEILSFFSLDDEQENQILEDYILVETRIANIIKNTTDTDEELEDVVINCMEPQYEWDFLCDLVANIADVADIEIEKSSVTVHRRTVPFLQKLFPFLHNCSKRATANFLAIRFIINHLKDMNTYFRKIKFIDPSHEFTNGHGLLSPCENWIAKHLPLALGRLYVIENFKEDQYNETLDLIENILEETKETVRRQDWMSKIIKDGFVDEFSTIRSVVHDLTLAYRNESFVEEYYKEFKPTEGPFMKNVLLCQLFLFKATISLTGDDMEKVGENEFRIGATFFGPIEINFGTLLFPIYSSGQGKILNTAFLGSIIAHEIGHALSYFVESRKENDTMKEAILERGNCIEGQYSRFVVEGKNHMGNRTYSEDSADQIGKKVVDNIIEKFVLNGGSLKLPGLNYSTEQILQMASETFFCTRGKIQEKSDTAHSPGFIRIIGRVQNSKTFRKAFSCSNGSSTNPEQQCPFLD